MLGRVKFLHNKIPNYKIKYSEIKLTCGNCNISYDRNINTTMNLKIITLNKKINETHIKII